MEDTLMSKHKQLIKKIIREELLAYKEKILDERKGVGLHKTELPGLGMRGGAVTMPEPEPNRAIPANKKRSTMTSIVDEPDSKPYFVEAIAEEAAQSDKDVYGVDTTSSLPTGGKDIGKISGVEGVTDPLSGVPDAGIAKPPGDDSGLTEAQIERLRKLANIIEVEMPRPDIKGIEAIGGTDMPEMPEMPETGPKPRPLNYYSPVPDLLESELYIAYPTDARRWYDLSYFKIISEMK